MSTPVDKMVRIYSCFSGLQSSLETVDSALSSVSEKLQIEDCCLTDLDSILIKFKELKSLIAKAKEDYTMCVLDFKVIQPLETNEVVSDIVIEPTNEVVSDIVFEQLE